MQTWEKWNKKNNSICSQVLQSTKENWAERKRKWGRRGRGRREGWGVGCLSPWAGGKVAGAQISRGRAKINCLLWWNSKIKACRPLLPLASQRERPYSVGTSVRDCVHLPWRECLNRVNSSPGRKKPMSFLLWATSAARPLISFQNSTIFVFHKLFIYGSSTLKMYT